MTKDTNILIRIDQATKEKAQQVARDHRVSLSDLIRGFLEEIAEDGIIPGRCFSKALALRKEPSAAEIKKAIEDYVAELNDSHIEKVYLFGSYSRGEQTPKSDIDLLIDFDDEASLMDLMNFKLGLENKLSKTVDAVSIDPKETAFYENIRKDQILLYER